MNFLEWVTLRTDEVERDILENHTRSNKDGSFILSRVEEACKKHGITLRELKKINQRLEVLARFYELEMLKEEESR